MWMNFTDEQWELIRLCLSTLKVQEAKDISQKITDELEMPSEQSAAEAHYRQIAMDMADDEMEVDEDAVVSMSDPDTDGDRGAFVMAWIWIPEENQETEEFVSEVVTIKSFTLTVD